MSRACRTCQHLKRLEIDRRLAAGEPSAQVARDYDLNVSSLHRHRINCLKLTSSNAIMKDAARGSAEVALLPSKETLSGAYFDLRDRIDQIVAQAEQQGSLAIAVSGLNSIRQTLDSLTRLAGHTVGAQVNIAVQTNVNVDLNKIVDRLIKHFDHEPELKAPIAQALVEIDNESST
jgi:autotransporter adhesin